MSRSAWIFLFLGVIAVHGALFLWIKDGPVIPESWRVDRSPPEPTFKYDEAKYVDPVTGEKMKVQEFTIRAPQTGPASPTP
jgi:hypothetical protein